MRTLVIAGDYPWPEDRGPRMRLAMVLRGLRRCGPVELVSVISQFRSDFGEPDESLGLAKVARIGFDNRPPSSFGILPTLWRPSMPLGMPWHDRPVVERALARFVSGRYDLVWCFGARPWVLAGEPVLAPTILDLDDLEDQKIAARIAGSHSPPPSIGERLRSAASTAVSQEEIRRWRRLHRRAGGRVSAIVVCSDLDAERAAAGGLTTVAVVPNGYRLVTDPADHGPVRTPPTLLFQGLLRYPPNIEAATLLAHEIGPQLRRTIPEARIRLVGDRQPELLSLHDPPRVEVVGRVPDIVTELDSADIVVVPIRFGSGTRIKILEAFAHRIPVVSTSLGAEGLAVRDGIHLLVGDTSSDLASACVRLLSEPSLRRSVTENAYQLFVDRYRSDVIEESVSRLARRIAAP